MLAAQCRSCSGQRTYDATRRRGARSTARRAAQQPRLAPVLLFGCQGLGHAHLRQRQAVEEATWTPHDFGLHETTLESLLVDGPLQSAAMIREILAGTRSPARDIVVNDSVKIDYIMKDGSLTASRVSKPKAGKGSGNHGTKQIKEKPAPAVK